MKKILITLMFVGCLGLVSCEKSQIITPASVDLNKMAQPDSSRAVNQEAEPPVIILSGGGPR